MRKRVRDTVASYVVQSEYYAEPQNDEDHTFNGVLFDIRVKKNLPIEHIEINAFWVRGNLGPMTVWTTKDTHYRKHSSPDCWLNICKARIPPSPRSLAKIPVEPVTLQAGESAGFYIHSGLRDDTGVSYSDQRRGRLVTHEDHHLAILPGMAHISFLPFSNDHYGWGAWRNRREFMGKVAYSVKWQLWNPDSHKSFPRNFRSLVILLLMANRFRPDCVLGWLSEDTIFHILHFCAWDWAGDTEGNEELDDLDNDVALARATSFDGYDMDDIF